ncbi:MAG: pyrophosphate--fructose-6-phosphate 1-phosphotransferase [Nitrospirota bacterium]|uniref:Pyrophosphate--fructose 6-phosphate 1-phosphotransferase n=1 Tax=Candidatus Magnetominusculus xianensis TaxID=1748249 RepID=A0ABR5SJ57_9BACT|nr:pyrophosphate--fructose-6-phosphate 1-phosphotransferase [Candidatus Magnetominusculus xianensis]KWT93339.1 pyrophosphate--fructose 6-phosphate 1-phosphotransferase [Candidatus Magnetominusculus xianensis]MBF0402317.1 pyrophosphate--fructose-6-phosphate 1-phosphotransferase [Nitrospirota bacterium]
MPKKVALLTAGGLAPCLSSAVGGLIQRYTEISPETEIIGFTNGYDGLLRKNFLKVTPKVRKSAHLLQNFGGSPLGNSRVKLSNVKDCVKKGLVKEGEDPLQVAAENLKSLGIEVLHTIGGDDTSLTAAELAKYLYTHGYGLTVIGLPKTVDNDITPIAQTLGAFTAAGQGARFFLNVVAETSANPKMLLVHEVMGRNCGYLTARTAYDYNALVKKTDFPENFGIDKDVYGIDAVLIPEVEYDLDKLAEHLKKRIEENDSAKIFISEGAGASGIVKELEAKGLEVPRDAFGHVKLDKVNVGQWHADVLMAKTNAGKVLVQKSGYFSRAARPNKQDLMLIKSMVDMAVEMAVKGVPGIIGHDEERHEVLRAIEFERIQGGKPFNPEVSWYKTLLKEIGQPDFK